MQENGKILITKYYYIFQKMFCVLYQSINLKDAAAVSSQPNEYL